MTRIQKGDIVRCLVGYYKSYGYGDHAIVQGIDVSTLGTPLLLLSNPLCDYGQSMYSTANWEFVRRPEPKEKKMTTTGYTKTQFFGLRINEESTDKVFMPFKVEPETPLMQASLFQTQTRNSKSEVIADIQQGINKGERWVILQTIGFIEPAEPKPVVTPIEITECR